FLGSRFSGIHTAIKVKQELGIRAQIFEASNDIGGTWHVNTYPNCACDTNVHACAAYSCLYSLDWSELYSPQKEIHEYQVNIAKKHNLYEQTRLQTRVIKTTWIDNERQWLLDLQDARTNKPLPSEKYSIVFVAVGSIRVPKVPEQFKGFTGPIVHTASWDSSVDFTGKKVAVVGSGASAVQTIPALVKEAKSLVNYIRTPIWCRLRGQYSYSRLVKFLFRWVPLIARFYRFYIYVKMEITFLVFGYYKGIGARLICRQIEGEMRRRIIAQGRPDLVSALIPDYPLGCKRVVVTDDYLESLCQPNVVIERNPIISVKGKTITTADGNKEEFDILCLATGFDVQGFLGSLEGNVGLTLNEAWRDKFPATYKTLAIHGYPNLFMILGPSSLLGHSSVLIMMECQVAFACQMIRRMIKEDIAAFEPTQDAQDAYAAELQKDLDKTVWKGNCSSWYVDSKGNVTALWSSTVTRFWWLMRKFDGFKDDFTLYSK
ncbi:hypothetical protein BX666DRAFT_1853340, partial [Dichotomocladium elegans]